MTTDSNTYRAKFLAQCPNNGCWIEYRLTITTQAIIKVEKLLDCVHSLRNGYHEAFADYLHKMFGAHQVLTAHHHGVDIETVRVPHTGRTEAPAERAHGIGLDGGM